MSDTPSDDRFSMPPIEGVWEGQDANESSDEEVEGSEGAELDLRSDRATPVLPPPGLFARLLTPSKRNVADLEREPEDDVIDDDVIDDELDDDVIDDELDDDDTDDEFYDDEGTDGLPTSSSAAPLAGVNDAVDIVEHLAAQAAAKKREPQFPSGDDFVFAEAAEGIAAVDRPAPQDIDDENIDDEDIDDEAELEAELEAEDSMPLALPSYALLRAAAQDEEAATHGATASLPMYGGDALSPEDDDEILPHFLLEEIEPLDVVGAQEQLREMAQENRRRAKADERKPSLARTLAEVPILLLVAALIAFLVKTFLAQAYYIPSGSMLPQLQIDDRVVVSKLAYKMHDPRRGDIVVFDDPRKGISDETVVERSGVTKLLRKVGEGVGVVQPSTDEFIKRVIALPGETVSGKNGFVYINDRKLIEPYLPDGLETADFPAQKVADNKVWVMGDNRGGSADSRIFGQIAVDTIVGRAVIKVWPPSSTSFL